MRRIYIYCEPCKKVIEKWACEHQFPNSSGRSAAPLTIYYEGPNGEIQIPGKTGRMPERLRKLGYEEKTIQDSKQYSDFCKRMDGDAKRKHERYMEALHERHEAYQKAEREEIRRHLETQYGRDFYEAAVAESERSKYSGSYNAGSHLEGFEYDSHRGRE